MSAKQELYRDMLTWALPLARNALSNFRRVRPCRVLFQREQRSLRAAYEVSELVHNVYVSLLDEEFTDHDLWFLNVAARSFCESNDGKTCQYYSLLCYYIQELFRLVPAAKKSGLSWQGPQGDFEWAKPTRGNESTAVYDDRQP